MKLSQRLATEFSAPHLQTALYRAGKAKSPFRRITEQILLAHHSASRNISSWRGGRIRPPAFDLDFRF
jgi:hypothetical protein